MSENHEYWGNPSDSQNVLENFTSGYGNHEGPKATIDKIQYFTSDNFQYNFKAMKDLLGILAFKP